MSQIIALMLFVTLSCVAVLHVYWALGGLWPARTEAALARTVVGVKGLQKMPGTALTLVVSVLIAVAAGLPLYFTGLLDLPISVSLPAIVIETAPAVVLGGLAVLFLGRGTLSYTGYFQKMEAEEPFVTLDRRYYAPLCLALGAGYACLALG